MFCKLYTIGRVWEPSKTWKDLSFTLTLPIRRRKDALMWNNLDSGVYTATKSRPSFLPSFRLICFYDMQMEHSKSSKLTPLFLLSLARSTYIQEKLQKATSVGLPFRKHSKDAPVLAGSLSSGCVFLPAFEDQSFPFWLQIFALKCLTEDNVGIMLFQWRTAAKLSHRPQMN